VTVELRDTEIDAMVKFGWLDPETRHDTSAIANALHDWFDTALRL
jgi:hypothetical protein